jgi:hypothetical protein
VGSECGLARAERRVSGVRRREYAVLGIQSLVLFFKLLGSPENLQSVRIPTAGLLLNCSFQLLDKLLRLVLALAQTLPASRSDNARHVLEDEGVRVVDSLQNRGRAGVNCGDLCQVLDYLLKANLVELVLCLG